MHVRATFTVYMSKQHFALRLLPCRPDFAQTMTDAESAIMGEHLAFWNDYMSQGKVIAFGPVLDPAGAYGLGIVSVDSEDEVKEMIQNDPAAAINTYEYYPMMAVVRESVA
jgi:uncharacterized protein YciI